MSGIRQLLRFLFYSYVVVWNMKQAERNREKKTLEIFKDTATEYRFSVSGLQDEIFPEFIKKGVRSMIIGKRVNAYSPDKQARIVLRYLALMQDERRYLREYAIYMASRHNNESVARNWARTRSRIKKLELVAETIIVQQIEDALREENTRSPWPSAKSIFPPVGFKFYPHPPNLVVISPRGGINRIGDFFVSPYLTQADTAKLESEIEAIKDGENRYSAYISDIGGCANVYPTIITPTYAKRCLDTIVHEWTHVFIMFTPVYQAKDKMFMSAMNETVAEYMGEEISNKIWDSYYEPYLDKKYGKVPPEEQDISPNKREKEYSKIMSETYHMVRECLDDGRYKEAEEYMQEGLNLLRHKGYPVRKMNSAYFAFYGQYAYESAFHGANGGLGALLHVLRQNTSLRDFLYTATSCTDMYSLKRAVNSAQREWNNPLA